jgi:hypothetical protein
LKCATKIITLPGINTGDVADHLASTDIRELMPIQLVGAAADVSNVSACLQSADNEGSLFIRKVDRLHAPRATWRATPANEELVTVHSSHTLPRKNRRMGYLQHMIDTNNYG